MSVINRKQFNKILKETIKDYKAMYHYKMVYSLENILKCKNFKDMKIGTITPLVELIEATKLRPIAHPVEYEIKEEHKKMEQYLRKFFNWKLVPNLSSDLNEMNVLILITRKGAQND